MGLSIEDGTEFVKKKLERDYNKWSAKTREILKNRYENIINVLFAKQYNKAVIQYKRVTAIFYRHRNKCLKIMIKCYIIAKNK